MKIALKLNITFILSDKSVFRSDFEHNKSYFNSFKITLKHALNFCPLEMEWELEVPLAKGRGLI